MDKDSASVTRLKPIMLNYIQTNASSIFFTEDVDKQQLTFQNNKARNLLLKYQNTTGIFCPSFVMPMYINLTSDNVVSGKVRCQCSTYVIPSPGWFLQVNSSFTLIMHEYHINEVTLVVTEQTSMQF